MYPIFRFQGHPWMCLHIPPNYNAIFLQIDEVCTSWEKVSFGVPLCKFLMQSGSWAEEFGYQIQKFLPEVQFVSKSPELSSTLDFELRFSRLLNTGCPCGAVSGRAGSPGGLRSPLLPLLPRQSLSPRSSRLHLHLFLVAPRKDKWGGGDELFASGVMQLHPNPKSGLVPRRPCRPCSPRCPGENPRRTFWRRP